MNDDEAHPRHRRRPGVLRAAARGAGPRDDGGRRDDDHRSGGRLELQHHERRVRRGPQGVRPGVRQSGRAAGAALERRHNVRAGELEARRSAELEAHALRGEQGEGDGHTPVRERTAHHRDQDGLGRVLMRLVRDAVLAAALFGCRPTASPPPSGRFTLLFFRRSPAASLGGLSWAPDPEHGRLVAFDRELRVTRQITHPRLATPVAVTPLGRTELLVTERTGEGVVVDTAGGGRVVREWESPDIASLYAAGAGRVAATRSPYYVPQLGSPEPDTAPLIRMLDTLGRPTGGLATIRRPATPLLDYVVNAGAVLAVFDTDSLVASADGSAHGTREPFGPAFALPDLAGDTVTLARFRGKVTLVNFWASWCDPCREEFPHMAELYHEFDRKDFEIAGLSDDVDSGRMLAFVRKYRPPFPILVGGGRMKQIYHYRGLPYSVLLDRRGRIIERIFGFGGAAEFRELHDAIAIEVRGP